MVVMLLGKLRGLPTHTDIIVDFEFKEVVLAAPCIGTNVFTPPCKALAWFLEIAPVLQSESPKFCGLMKEPDSLKFQRVSAGHKSVQILGCYCR